ncbi:MAG: hypothetical protein JKY37_13475 [Nannocystaceae bacterium]|nr:hypothetical protein [Nannocystaceae bacterium]
MVVTRLVNDPATGTVADRLEAIYPVLAVELLAWDIREEKDVFTQCASVRDGHAPLATLPLPCRAMIVELAPELDALVAARGAQHIGDASRWQDLQWWPLARAVTAVALRARIMLEEGHAPQRAVDACLGIVELWRDISHVAAIQTASASSTLVIRIAPVCRDAVAQLGSTARRDARTRLLAALSDAAPISSAVRREALLGELAVFVPSFVSGTPTTLHPAAQRRADKSRLINEPAQEPWWLAPFVLPAVWQSYIDVMNAIARHADDRPQEATQAIRAILGDPEIADLARSAASARWGNHLQTQHGAREIVRGLAAGSR